MKLHTARATGSKEVESSKRRSGGSREEFLTRANSLESPAPSLADMTVVGGGGYMSQNPHTRYEVRVRPSSSSEPRHATPRAG